MKLVSKKCIECGKPISPKSIMLNAKKRRERGLMPKPLKRCSWECRAKASDKLLKKLLNSNK